MLPIIVLFFALMMTITSLRITLNDIEPSSKMDSFACWIINVITYSMWCWLFWLIH